MTRVGEDALVDEEFVFLGNRDVGVVDGVVGEDGEGVDGELAPREGQLAILSAEHGDRLSTTVRCCCNWGRTRQGGSAVDDGCAKKGGGWMRGPWVRYVSFAFLTVAGPPPTSDQMRMKGG